MKPKTPATVPTQNAPQTAKIRPLAAEILRFLIVGGVATLIDMFLMGVVLYICQPQNYHSFFQIFYGADSNPTTTSTVIGTGVGFIGGLIFNYLFSIIFVFREKGRAKSVSGFLLFALLALIGLGIHLIGMYVGYDRWHLNEWLVKIVLTIVVLVYNYVTRKLCLFKPKQGVKQ